MKIHGNQAAIGLAIMLLTMSLDPVIAAGEERPGTVPSGTFILVGHEERGDRPGPEGDDPRTMSQAEWHMLAQKVATNLHWIGIQMGVEPQVRAVYVPALTQEYLQAFQVALVQGATKQQADILASQYIFARIRQLGAQTGPGSQGSDGCVYSRGGSFCAGSDGFRSFTFR